MAGKIRAVLDANVVVSGLINPFGPPGAILKALQHHRFILVSSQPVNEEILEVLNRPTIRDKFDLGDRIFDMAFILWERAELVVELPAVKVSNDADDDKYLATALAGGADYLVTGDIGDLLHLHEYKGVAIVSPKEFL